MKRKLIKISKKQSNKKLKMNKYMYYKSYNKFNKSVFITYSYNNNKMEFYTIHLDCKQKPIFPIKLYGSNENIKKDEIYNLNSHILPIITFLIKNKLYFGCTMNILNNKIYNILPADNLTYTFFKTVKLQKVPLYILARKYLLNKNESYPISKIIIFKLSNGINPFNILYKEIKFLNTNDYEEIIVNNYIKILKHDVFVSNFTVCFNNNEYIFKKNNTFNLFLNKLIPLKYKNDVNIIKQIYELNSMLIYDEIYRKFYRRMTICYIFKGYYMVKFTVKLIQHFLYILLFFLLLGNTKEIFLSFVEIEKFILYNIPIYYSTSILSYYPFESFFYGKKIPRAIEYMKLEGCINNNYWIKPFIKIKHKISTKSYIFTHYLSKKYKPIEYVNYLDSKCDIISKKCFVICDKYIYTVDIFSAYGSSFLHLCKNIETKKKYYPFYLIALDLYNKRKKTKNFGLSFIYKNLLIAGCYGSLNMMLLNQIFPTDTNLLKDIVCLNGNIMEKSYKILQENEYKVIYSKNDSHFFLSKNNVDVNITELLDKLNNNDYTYSKFKFDGKYKYCIFFNQNSYVLQKEKIYNKETDVLKGKIFNSLTIPTVIKKFGLFIIEKIFGKIRKINFNLIYQEFKKTQMITFSNFMFTHKDKYVIYVNDSEHTTNLHFIEEIIKCKYYINAKYTYRHFENKIYSLFKELKIWTN